METNVKTQMSAEDLADWIDKKRDQREALYNMADKQTKAVFDSPDALNAHLKLQAQFGKMSVTNTLLVGAQMPEAKQLRSFDDWQKRGRNVSKGAKAVLLLQPQREYTREAGTPAMGFDAKPVFDVYQTYGKELRNRNYPPARAVIKALLTKPSIPIVWNEKVTDACYNPDTNQIEARRNMDADQFMYAVSREYAIADGADPFTAECAATIACYRYSMMPEPISYDSSLREKNTRDLKDILNNARDEACSFCDSIDLNLQKQRERKSEER